MKPENKQTKSETKVESKQGGSNTPLILIGGVLLLALGGGWWLYNSSKTNTPAATTNANRTNTNGSANQNLYANAKPGANPAWSKGAPNAAVTIEEFADFQCPTCAQMHPRVNEIRAAYGDRVRIIFRHLPLTMHDKAYDAAVAAEAAGMQGKFWDMQNILFANQQTWARSTDFRTVLNDYAQKIGLDVQKFNSDMAGMQTKLRVDADMQRANSLAVRSTPSFYINGRLVESLDVSYMRQIIDAELQKAGK